MTKKSHNPPHLFFDNSPYFISSTIYKKRHLLSSPRIKDHLLTVIQQSFAEKSWQLHAWVILDNHYHLMVTSSQGKDLSRIISKIHMLSAQFIRSKLDVEKPIWWNYWDYCPRDENDYFVRLNYLYNNPVKHGYVSNLADYPHSSFHQLLKEQGRENVVRQFKQHTEYKQLHLEEDAF